MVVDLLRDRFGAVGLDVGDDNLDLAFAEGQCNTAADAGSGSGDDGDLSFELHGNLLSQTFTVTHFSCV